LHSLVGFLELLSISDLDDDQLRLMEQVMTSADCLVLAMDRIMLLLSLAGGSQPSQQAPVALDELLDRVLCDAGPRSGRGKIRFTSVLEPSLRRCALADPQLLQHLLCAMIDGAVDRWTAGAGGTVTVTAAVLEHGGELALHVDVTEPDDAVAGGAPTHLVEIALTEALTASLGGTLTRARGESGAHSVTSVSVPLTPVEATSTVHTPPAAAPTIAVHPPAALRVLLAEDNEINRMLAQRQLGKLGHVLRTVEGGVAAVQAVCAGEVDVVLMDCHMPDIDGLEATRQIRAAEAHRGDGRRVPIIAVTADALPENRAACLAAGMDDFLSKPVDLTQLSDALHRWTATDGASAAQDADAPLPSPSPIPRQSTLPEGEAVDHSVLAAILDQLGGDRAAVASLVETYLARLPAYRLRLRAALRHRAPDRLMTSARTLRSASDAVGAVELSRACAALERRGEEPAPAVSASLVAGLLDTCDRTVEALARYRESAPDPPPVIKQVLTVPVVIKQVLTNPVVIKQLLTWTATAGACLWTTRPVGCRYQACSGHGRAGTCSGSHRLGNLLARDPRIGRQRPGAQDRARRTR
jgi:CheY-like chemotaxis protein